MKRITAVIATRSRTPTVDDVVVELRQHPTCQGAGQTEHAGVEDGADERVSPAERDEGRRGRVDERRRRPAEEDEGGEREDEAERDAVRVGALDRDREALGERRGDEERADAGDRRRRSPDHGRMRRSLPRTR